MTEETAEGGSPLQDSEPPVDADDGHPDVALTMTAEATARISATAETATNLWMTWVEIALEQASAARQARANSSGGSGPEAIDAIHVEFKAAVTAVVAAAFAVDGFYIAVNPMVTLPVATEATLHAGGARRTWVNETIKAGFMLGAAGPQFAKDVNRLYKLRDRVVHHKLTFGTGAPHPSGLPGVSAERALLTAEMAEWAAGLAVDLIAACIARPRAANAVLAQWCSNSAHLGPHINSRRTALSIP